MIQNGLAGQHAQMDDGENMHARNGGILNALFKIDERQFLDGKHNSKLADTVIIDLRHNF